MESRNKVKYCPLCGSNNLVFDSREVPYGIWRRRKCLNPNCKHRFTTIEVSEKDYAKLKVLDSIKEQIKGLMDDEEDDSCISVDDKCPH